MGVHGIACAKYKSSVLPAALGLSPNMLMMVSRHRLRHSAQICAANVNRSMEAHKLLKEAGLQVSCKTLAFNVSCMLLATVMAQWWAGHALDSKFLQVQSFGVNTRVKLPGESQDSPNHYGVCKYFQCLTSCINIISSASGGYTL